MSQQPDYSQAPDSPIHPNPDDEAINLPSEPLKEEDLDLDLNPELTSDSEADATEIPSQRSNLLIGDSINEFRPNIVQSPIVSNNQIPRRLSASQKSKFLNYVDERLLHIQRRFVQSFGLNDIGYNNIDELLLDLKQVIDFIWLSIDLDSSSTQTTKTSFGQVNYLITIANDLLDYVAKLPIKSNESAHLLLKVINSLDTKFTRLIEFSEVEKNLKYVNRTEIVRIYGIAERSRIVVTDVFDKGEVEGFHYDLSRVYYNVLDRQI